MHDSNSEQSLYIDERPKQPYIYVHQRTDGHVMFKRYPQGAEIPKLDTTKDPQMAGKIYIVQAYHAAAIFLNGIWEEHKEKFSMTDFKELSVFCGFLGSPTSLEGWRESYLRIIGKTLPLNKWPSPSIDQIKITFDEAFRIMNNLCIWHYNNFRCNFPQLLELLGSMIKNPILHESEWNLWQQAIDRACGGEEMGFG